ncbi:hypothetical protein LXL04_036970 [Taraxacum kok-saghyz]
MAMSSLSLSPATSSVRSVYQQPKLNTPKSLLSLQGNSMAWSSSASYVKLQSKITLVVRASPQKRQVNLKFGTQFMLFLLVVLVYQIWIHEVTLSPIIKCATIEEIDAEKSLIEKNARDRMDKAIDSVLSNFNSIRTGRSNPAMLDKVEVEYYGSPVNLKTIAQISTPDSSSLLINPYDKSSLKSIEKAIVNSDLGLTPSNDGEVIRLSIPQLTSDRRKELSKIVAKQAEEGKVAIRNIRRDAIKSYDKLEKEKKLSEDNVKDLSADLQKVTDEYMKKIETIFKQKEKEVLTV